MAQMAEGAPASRYDWDSQAKHPNPGGMCKWIFSVVYDTHENRKGGRSKEKKKSEVNVWRRLLHMRHLRRLQAKRWTLPILTIRPIRNGVVKNNEMNK